jgi:hypothetical protein
MVFAVITDVEKQFYIQKGLVIAGIMVKVKAVQVYTAII